MAALEVGSLDGRIVEFQTELKTVAWPCPADVPEPCTRFYVDGLPGIAVTYDGMLGGSDRSYGGAGVSQLAGTFLVVPRAGHLELLGRLPGTLDRPLSIQDAFGASRFVGSGDPLVVTAVAGWLVTRGARFCPILLPGGPRCPGGQPVLTDRQPSDGGMVSSLVLQDVGVHDGAAGIDPGGIVTKGPFLLRRAFAPAPCPKDTVCDRLRSPWSVVAGYDPAEVLVVYVP